MKGHTRSIRKVLKQSFERVQTLPPADSKPAWERLMDRRRENLEGVFEGPEFADPVRFQPSRVRPMWAAVAAAAVSAVVLSVAFWPTAPAVMEDVAGSLNIEFGQVVRSSDSTGQRLVLADSSRIEMRSKSELWLERADDGVRIQLRNGGIIVTAAKQRTGHLYVQTKDVMVSVVGTVFLVNAEEEGSRVAVIEGEVRVQQQGATEQKLGPGEQVSTNPKMESIPLQKEVDWSRDAVAHVATLGQAGAATAPAQKEEPLAFEVATIRPAAPVATRAGTNPRGGGAANGGAQACSGRTQLDPRRYNVRNVTLLELVATAHESCSSLLFPLLPFPRLAGGPDWVRSERWDIEALIREGSVDPLPTTAFGGPNGELNQGRSPKVQKMIRTLVEERFKVVVRRETKEAPVYVLTVVPGGPKFQGNEFIDAKTGMMLVGGGMMQPGTTGATVGALVRGGAITPMTLAQGAQTFGAGVGRCMSGQGRCFNAVFANVFMDTVVRTLSQPEFAGRYVLDRTGIQERVSFMFERESGTVSIVEGQPIQSIDFKELSRLLETVGLQLKEEPKGQVETFVIDRAERPAEN